MTCFDHVDLLWRKIIE